MRKYLMGADRKIIKRTLRNEKVYQLVIINAAGGNNYYCTIVVQFNTCDVIVKTERNKKKKEINRKEKNSLDLKSNIHVGTPQSVGLQTWRFTVVTIRHDCRVVTTYV